MLPHGNSNSDNSNSSRYSSSNLTLNPINPKAKLLLSLEVRGCRVEGS